MIQTGRSALASAVGWRRTRIEHQLGAGREGGGMTRAIALALAFVAAPGYAANLVLTKGGQT
jgi:hypothetical protein